MIENFESGATGVFSAGAGTTLAIVTNNGVVPAIDGTFSGSSTGDQAGTGGSAGGGIADQVIVFTFIVDPGTYNVSVDIQAIADVAPTESAEASFDPNGVVASHSFQPSEFTQVAADEWASPVFTLTAQKVDASGGTISGSLNLDRAFRWLFDNLRVAASEETPQALLERIESKIDEFLGTGDIHQSQASSLFAKTGAIGESLARGDPSAARGQAGALLNHVAAQGGKAITESAAAVLSGLISRLIDSLPLAKDPCACTDKVGELKKDSFKPSGVTVSGPKDSRVLSFLVVGTVTCLVTEGDGAFRCGALAIMNVVLEDKAVIKGRVRIKKGSKTPWRDFTITIKKNEMLGFRKLEDEQKACESEDKDVAVKLEVTTEKKGQGVARTTVASWLSFPIDRNLWKQEDALGEEGDSEILEIEVKELTIVGGISKARAGVNPHCGPKDKKTPMTQKGNCLAG